MPRPKNLSKPKHHPDYLPPAKRPPKTAIYVRVSTHHQVDRESLPFQRQELENYARYVLKTAFVNSKSEPLATVKVSHLC